MKMEKKSCRLLSAKQVLKRTAWVFLVFLLSVSVISAEEAPSDGTDEPELIDSEFYVEELPLIRRIEDDPIQTFALDPSGQVTLKDGNAVRWIDRIEMPDYAKALYQVLEEGADNDGDRDYLIDVTQAEKDEYGYGIPFAEITQIAPDGDLRGLGQSMMQECSQYAYAAIGAFDRDHPEVFWIEISHTRITYSIGYYSDNSAKVFARFYFQYGDQPIYKTEYYPNSEYVRAAINQRDQYIERIFGEMPDSAVTTADKTAFFNDWLALHNEYNTVVSGQKEGVPLDLAWECISALQGSIGSEGPTCEGYSRAFMALCQKAGIPCVLVDGNDHMWNYIQIGSGWYGVDVTWNDPISPRRGGAVSGQEGRDYFLVGANTWVNGQRFIDDHPVENTPINGIGFINGPQLSPERYVQQETVGLTVSGSILSPDASGNAQCLLYENINATDAILEDLLSGNPSKMYAKTLGTEPAADEDSKLYRQDFTLDDVESGEYLLVVYCSKKYAPLILPVTVDGKTVSVREQRLWLLGDVNNDGRLNSADAQQIQRYIVGTGSVFDNGTEADKANRLLAANVNWITGNMRIDSTDAQQIQRYLVGAASVLDGVK